MKAPDFPEDLHWLNTDKKLSLEDLRGKFILLDFWTYCSIDCMQVIPDLKHLEEKYPQLFLIGVHSAKFQNERTKENVEQAILRYGIEHPVVIDNDFEMWKIYGITSWPSFVFIAPDGEVIGKTSGEGIYDRLDPHIVALSREYEGLDLLNKEPIELQLSKETAPSSVLSFPGKVAADPFMRRLLVSDSNHNRIVAVDLEGHIVDIAGSGRAGRDDGSFQEASFFRPQGLAFDAEVGQLYVADTDNHLVRRLDFISKRVTTIFGTGKQGTPLEPRGPGRDVSLSSPWDLTIFDRQLYVANAGTHQIWRLDLESLVADVYAGTGKKGIFDGPADMAALAQPSGIDSDGEIIYFADSEASALRVIEGGVVTSLIGSGLFEFGDADGPFKIARLQHPIGVHYHEGLVYVADSYNHKVKVADLQCRSVTTLIGNGKPGFKDGPAQDAQLNEPNGIAFLESKLYITDTNNHAVRVYDPEKRNVSTLVLKEGSGVREACDVCSTVDLNLDLPSSTKPGGRNWEKF